MKTARWFAALAFLAVPFGFDGSIAPAFGHDHFWRQTAYVGPVETAWVVPTSYVSTSYVVPTSYVSTSYVYPTSYVSTSYVYPTSYYVPTAYYELTPTSYVLPSYFAATSYTVSPTSYYVPTSLAYYWPTAYYEPTVAYYAPTVIEYPVATTAAVCQEAPTRIERATPSATVRSAPSTEPTRRKTPQAVESQPAAAAEPGGPPVSSRVDTTPSEAPAAKGGTPSTESPKVTPGRLESLEEKPNEPQMTPLSPPPAAEEPKEKVISPPNPPPAEPVPAPVPAPSKKAAEALPAVPVPSPDGGNPATVPLDLPPLGETTYRKAQKPVFGSPSMPFGSVLHGVVKSGATGELVEGAPITLSSRSGQATNRNLESDAYGRFAVRLADGDWDVLVTMPSGRVYTVSRLSVSNGKIVDDLGRKIPSLIITR